MSSPATARLRLLAAAALFSTGGAAVKAVSLTAWQVACFRSATAAVALLLLLPSARRLREPRVWVAGLAYSVTMICFVTANKLTTAANTIFLQSAAPLYLLVLAPLLLRERLRRQDLAVMAVIAAGMAILFSGETRASEIATDPVRGNLLALTSGVAWAFTLVALRWLGRHASTGGGSFGVAAVVAGNLIAAGVSLPWALPVTSSSAVDWAAILYLGVFQIGLAYVLLTSAMGEVPAMEASLLLLLEPVLNPIWAWLFLGEGASPQALVGGGVILAAVVARTLIETRERRLAGIRAAADG